MSRDEQPGSRDRLVDSARRLMSRQGYEATVVKDIARGGNAPMGSFYYHFPGGKEELAVAAMRRGAEQLGATFAATLDSHDEPGEALAACALALADGLEASDWQDGCPVATTALETVGRSPQLQQAAAESFMAWRQLFAQRLKRAGIPTDEADDLALTALALIEGAEMIARVQASRNALDLAAAALRVLTPAVSESGR